MLRVLNRKYPVAKKEYHCGFCAGVIEKGEKYECQSNVTDYGVETFRCHEECGKLASTFGYEDVADWDEGISSDDFEEYIDNWIKDNGYYNSETHEYNGEFATMSLKEQAKAIYEDKHKETLR